MTHYNSKNIEIVRGKAVKMLVLTYIEALSGDCIRSGKITILALL